MIKISVVMPVYNGERFLKEAIDSVLNQTFRKFELIIINDGSTDNTKKIIKSFNDKRIIYIENMKNRTYSNFHNVVNQGLEIAKGKYIARLDADDVCILNRFEKQFNYLEKNKDIFMVGSSALIINEKGEEIDKIMKRNYPSILYKMYVGFSNSFIHSSIMFRNDGCRYPHCMEHIFYFWSIANGKKLKNMKGILIKYRINSNGVTAKYLGTEGNKYGEFYSPSTSNKS